MGTHYQQVRDPQEEEAALTIPNPLSLIELLHLAVRHLNSFHSLVIG